MITIIDQPYRYTPVHQKLMVVCSSTNVANSGFRYVYDFGTFTVNVQPNANGIGMLDLCPLFEEETSLVSVNSINGLDYANLVVVNCTIREGWLVGGVFTISGSDSAEMDSVTLFDGEFQLSDGYKPNPRFSYGMLNYSDYLLSDLIEGSYPLWNRWSELGLSNKFIYIPTRLRDAGIIAFPTANAYLDNIAESCELKQYDNSGTLLSTHTTSLLPDTDKIMLYGIYPYNLDAGAILEPTMAYYTFKLIDSLGGDCSRTYCFYLIEDDCRYTNVRLGWSNTRGGYDYFNFTQNSETSYQLERKQFQKVVGSYNASTFGFNSYDRSKTDRKVLTTKGISVNTNWITKGQFEFLTSLMRSNDVWIINDDGSQTPVLVDSSQHNIKSGLDGKLYNLSLNLKYSQSVGI